MIFLASLSVSLNIRTSSSLIGPLTFRVNILPLSFPSRIFTLTWVISPATPVLPIIWIICAGYKRKFIEECFIKDPSVKVVNTGLKTESGSRIKKIRNEMNIIKIKKGYHGSLKKFQNNIINIKNYL